ncbi:MAG TPA: NfeD family protein [Ilumatobacteraceae bacterium]|nr:NfeD family protein [Ilumatobacteraceae bacterium]
MNDPDNWRWIWMAVGVAFILGEMATPGSFFMLPFAVGAVVACVVAFSGGGIGLQWLLFVAVSAIASAALVPLRRKLDVEEPLDGVGARRLLNQDAVVISAVGPGPNGVGRVRLGREEWRAESATRVGIPEGAVVKVIEVRGTCVVVAPGASTAGGNIK